MTIHNQLPEDHKSSSRSISSIIGSTMKVSALSFLGISFNMVYQLLTAQRFGAGIEMDAYLAAIVLPNLILLVLLTSLDFTFVPVFIAQKAQGNEKHAWLIANGVLNLIFWVLMGICIIGVIFAPQIMRLIAPGFENDQYVLSVTLFRILLPSIVFDGVSRLLSSLHYSIRSFALPATLPLVYTAINIACLWLFTDKLGIGSLAVGTTLGTLAQIFFLLPLMMRNTKYDFMYFGLKNSDVTAVFKLMVPLLVTGILTRSASLIERIIGSGLPEGSISYLGYAMKTLSLLSGMFISGLTITIFPLMAEYAADENRRHLLGDVVMRGINLMLFITLPIAVLLGVLRVPLISLILERGAFDQQASLGTATALLFYLGFFVAAGLGNVLSRTFYVLKDTITPAIIGILGIVYYLILSIFLVKAFSFAGLAMAMSIHFLTAALVMVGILLKKLPNIQWRGIVYIPIRIGIASAISGVVAYYLWVVWGISASVLLGLSLCGGAGVITYLLSAWLLRIPEMSYLKDFIAQKGQLTSAKNSDV